MPIFLGPVLVWWTAALGQSAGQKVSESFVGMASAYPWVWLPIASIGPAMIIGLTVLMLRRSDDVGHATLEASPPNRGDKSN